VFFDIFLDPNDDALIYISAGGIY